MAGARAGRRREVPVEATSEVVEVVLTPASAGQADVWEGRQVPEGHTMREHRKRSRILNVALVLGMLAQAVGAQEVSDAAEEASEKSWDTTLARGETREVEFETDVGTFMSVDISPDGEWIVFDLLGHVYRVPAAGGDAECLTQDSGVAVNYHPRYSPDGEQIAFVSDRKGQDNLWAMDADGANPRQVQSDSGARALTPAWSADGDYLYVRLRGLPRPGSRPAAGLWMFHRDGGKGLELVGRDEEGAAWPAPSADGRFLYFHVRAGRAPASGQRNALAGDLQIRRLDLVTGALSSISAGVGAQQVRSSSGGLAAPQVSPDGRKLAFIRRIPDGTISYKGHRFGPRTALWLRDLETGSERILMDPVEQDMIEGMKILRVFPGYAWAPDGRSLVLSQGGKLRRVFASSGEVRTIPFTAKVARTISEQAHRPFRISDDPFEAHFLRWHTASPDGSRLAFQAVGKVWIRDLPDGQARRLTADDFEPFEYAPSWSPDGRSIAFTTWHDSDRGQLWRTPAVPGGTPVQVSREAGEYIHPDWSPDGSTIVVARGAGATARARNFTNNPFFELVLFPVTGGAPRTVGRVERASGFGGQRSQLPRPQFGPDARIFFLEAVPEDERGENGSGPRVQLVSVSSDPEPDEQPRVHARFRDSDEVAISPDGRNIAFLAGDNLYLSPFPYRSSAGKPVLLAKDAKSSALPVEAMTKIGGLFPNWRSPEILELGSANTYTTYDTTTDSVAQVTVSLSVDRDIPSGRVALVGARVITLDGDEVLEDATLVIDGSRLECVGECASAGVDRVIDVQGSTIVPGFVDMHAHHYREYNGIIPKHPYETAIYLAYGVTTNLDNSMWSQNVFSAAELIDAGRVIGPRTFSTGDPLYNRDGARQSLLTSYEVAEQNIQRLKSWGAVSIKQYLQPRRDQRQWVSDVARKEGLMVTSEGSDLAYNLGMIMDGQTAFEHPMSYMPIYDDVATFFGQAKAVYSPTFVVGGPAAWNEEYFWSQTELWRDRKQRLWLPWRQLVPHTRRRILRPDTDYSYPIIAQGMADVIAHGGYGAIGSHGQQHGIASHWEIWMAASAMGNHGALDVASRHGAYFLGALQDLGTLEPGKLADLIVLDSNPLDDIRNTLDMRYVMKGGVLYDAETLDQLWPRQEPFGERPWVSDEIYRADDRPTSYHDPGR